ncbi:MAG: UvrD-helicase domain-containing protein, partial [Deltaproteobacteria bacterium]|nr:UvrD-helicase domain-containing protein [Deltaproteobacteria bacterium]
MSSTNIVLSAEQRAAILTPGNLLVRAGAGSGKTEVLARRFVALIAGEIEGRQPLTPA